MALSSFDPQLNDEFEILTSAELVVGTFSSTILPPIDSGLAWSVRYDPTSVVLKVVSALAADFNDDGDVDAGDLVRWRTNFGTGTTHQQGDADDDSDVDGGDFLVWQQELGSPAVTVASEPVPEPGALILVSLAGFSLALIRQRVGATPTFIEESR